MTTKVFWQDPYLTTLDTLVTTVNDEHITIAETIFYALAGGQESDAGTIGGRRVLQARKDGLEIIYTLEGTAGLLVGTPVRIEIEWQRRYRLMRLHFATELVLELTYRRFPGIPKIGAHIAEDKARVDFEWGENLGVVLPEIAAQVAALIAADHPIISEFSDREKERRYWEIEGFARVSCGGTHVRRTGEIGRVKLRRKNVGKNKERIEITLVD